MAMTTVDLQPELIERAQGKATRENLDIAEVVRLLLARWISGDVGIESEDRARLAERALKSRGIWQDRDPDAYLAASRAGLSVRDEDLGDARLVV
jgi:hypothetical protein